MPAKCFLSGFFFQENMKKIFSRNKMNPSKLETNQITTDLPQEQQSGNNKFISILIRKNDSHLDLKTTSRMKIFSHNARDSQSGQLTFSPGINLENENLLSFQKIQDEIQNHAEKAKPQVRKISNRLGNFRKD